MKKWALPIGLILLAGLTFSSCKKKGCTDPNATNYSSEAKEDDGSCTLPTDNSKDIPFAVNVKHKLGIGDFAYNTKFMLKDSTYVSFTLCRMYLSGFMLDGYDATTKDFQSSDYFLLKPEDNSINLGKVPKGSYNGFLFNRGVDSLTNNTKQPTDFTLGDALGPQNPTMHWGWQQKYIFIKIEGLYDSDSSGTPNEVFQYHMGADKYFAAIDKYGKNAFKVNENGDNSVNITIDWTELIKDYNIAKNPKSHMTDSVSDAIMANASKMFE